MTEPQVELWYLPSALKYAELRIAGLAQELVDYCRVFACPEREMLGKSVAELADELLDLTNAPDWAARSLRPMRWGDAAKIHGNTCLYIPADGAEAKQLAWPLDVASIVQLKKWPNVALAVLRKPQ